MTPLKRSNNIAARMGRWSAGHRKTAVFGWLGFVVLALVTRQDRRHEAAQGRRREHPRVRDRRAKILNEGLPATPPRDESVFVESAARRSPIRPSAPSVADVVRSIRQTGRENVRSPFDARPPIRSRMTADGARHVGHEGRRTTAAATKIDADPGARSPSPRRAIRTSASSEFGAASAGKALDDTVGDDFKLAGDTALPMTLGVLIVVFGALVAVGVPLLLALSGVMATIGLSRSRARSSRWIRTSAP